MQTQDSKVVVETKLAIIMAECNTKGKEIMPRKNDSNKNEELKRLFEGESCGLAYNSDDDWFDDEDEEFVFDPNGSNQWFEDAWLEGLKEAEEMRRVPERKKDEEDEKIKENTIVINIIF
jgi:hypothetical protein